MPTSYSDLSYCQPIIAGGYHPAAGTAINGDPTLPLRYPRFFTGSPSTQLPQPPPQPPQPPPQPYLYASPSRPISFPTTYNPPQHHMNEYCVGHVLSSNNQQCHQNLSYAPDSSTYTCIGAPVGQGFNAPAGASRVSELLGSAAGGAGSFGRDGSSTHNPDGLNWGRSFAGTWHN